MIRSLMIAFIITATAWITPRTAHADAPNAGDFSSFGIQWNPPREVKYTWPIFQGYVASYDFSDDKDKSVATIRIMMSPARRKTLAKVSDEVVAKSKAPMLSAGPKIGGEPSMKLITPTNTGKFKIETLYLVVHNDITYTFSSYSSGAADQAAALSNNALDVLVSNVAFLKPVSPREHVADELLPPFRYEGELSLRLPSAMRVISQPGKPARFILRDYATGSDALLLTLDTTTGSMPSLTEKGAQDRLAEMLASMLKTRETPVLAIAPSEPSLLIVQPLHPGENMEGAPLKGPVQAAIAALSKNRQIQIMFFLKDKENENAYLALTRHILDSIRISEPKKVTANPLPPLPSLTDSFKPSVTKPSENSPTRNGK